MIASIHIPANPQINLDEQRTAHADRFYLSHITHVKHDAVFKGKHILYGLFFYYRSLFSC